jgi:hypothetical protein
MMMRRKKKKQRARAEQGGSSLVEVRDRWFQDVPDVETAYWLKEDFSDILQLRDRQKAEELTDLWLARVGEFIRHLRSQYQGGKGRKWSCPFTNVLTTVKMWRPHILNYIDSKNCYSLTATNYFAEHVNNKLKRAASLSHGVAFETLRIKAIHGGVMVKRRPPHPLSEPQVRRKRGRGSNKSEQADPDSNLAQLKRAREDRDETRDLLARPRETPGWVSRFGWSIRPAQGPPSARPEAWETEDSFQL